MATGCTKIFMLDVHRLVLKKPADKAANPATSPPMSAVTRINNNELPPSGRTFAILSESKPWFLISIMVAINAQRRNTPMKPARKLLPGLMGISNATRKAAIAMLHQGSHMPATNESNAVSMIDTKNFMYTV